MMGGHSFRAEAREDSAKLGQLSGRDIHKAIRRLAACYANRCQPRLMVLRRRKPIVPMTRMLSIAGSGTDASAATDPNRTSAVSLVSKPSGLLSNCVA
jgi:hypothetical protein